MMNCCCNAIVIKLLKTSHRRPLKESSLFEVDWLIVDYLFLSNFHLFIRRILVVNFDPFSIKYCHIFFNAQCNIIC